jgi:hypothetical protein
MNGSHLETGPIVAPPSSRVALPHHPSDKSVSLISIIPSSLFPCGYAALGDMTRRARHEYPRYPRHAPTLSRRVRPLFPSFPWSIEINLPDTFKPDQDLIRFLAVGTRESFCSIYQAKR